MVTPEQRVIVLQAEVEAFKTYLSSLPAEAWNQPSACEGWTVADVVAHLPGDWEAMPRRRKAPHRWKITTRTASPKPSFNGLCRIGNDSAKTC